MPKFAQIGDNDIVLQVIVVSDDAMVDKDGIQSESIGSAFCSNLIAGEWVLSSDDGLIRKNPAAIGYTYDRIRDAFIPPQPASSWTLDADSCQWMPPKPRPTDRFTLWHEESQQWVDPQPLKDGVVPPGL